MRFLGSFILILCATFSNGQVQVEMDIASQIALERAAADEFLDVYVEAEASLLLEYASQESLFYKYHFRGQHVLRLKPYELSSLLKQPFVKAVDLNPNRGQVLSNNSIKLTNAASVRSEFEGVAYSGKGVLVGILDAGIDFNHPDFQNDSGDTRIRAIWDQNQSFHASRTPSFGYGQVWNSQDIDSSICTHVDNPSFFGHGSNVSGIAAGNGKSVPDSIGDFAGYATEADLAVVSIDFSAVNFTEKVADGVQFLLNLADSLNVPCVLNASLGTYMGSHDGLDLPALRIDSMLKAQKGRAMVAAAGNSGNWAPFHLHSEVNSDTAFTWFKYSSFYGAVFYELWADLADFDSIQFSIGADEPSSFNFRGQTPFDDISNRLNTVVTDTLKSISGNRLGVVQTWAEKKNGRYRLQVYIPNPDSSNYLFRFITAGTGSFDLWSSPNIGTIEIVYQGLPSSSLKPEMAQYRLPDIDQSMVSSWTCLPSVITVGNHINRDQYIDYVGNLQSFPEPSGSMAASSSRGPSRIGVQKPDLIAPGERTLTAGKLTDLNIMRVVPSLQVNLAPGGFHFKNGGTSMASPAIAGICALLLERCSDVGVEEMVQLVRDACSGDAFTSNLPNNLNGYGKIDAEKLFQNRLYSPNPASVLGINRHCPGDSLPCHVPGFDFQSWPDGSTDSVHYISALDTLFAFVEDSLACPGMSIPVVSYEHVPEEIDELKDTSICIGDRWILTSNHPVVEWSDGSMGVNTLVSTVGDYWLDLEDQNGCVVRDSFSLIQINPLPVVDIEPPSDTICQGGRLNLVSELFEAYLWNTGFNARNLVVEYDGMSPSEYSISVIDSNGCSGSDSIEVFFEVCAGEGEFLTEPNLSIFPNPSEASVQLSGLNAPSPYKLFNIGGQLYSEGVIESHVPLELGELPSGQYFLEIHEKGELRRLKFILE